MRALGPFEPSPTLAVAVSGGADSMALCLLAQGWATARGGHVLALTVDHGLRPDAAAEAAQVAAWMARLGVPHQLLRWAGPPPATGIQAAARIARYRLMIDCCRAAGILHLLLGHHAADQAETVLQRLLRGSGIAGLAGMAPLLETREVRLLRPLLAEDPDALRRLLQDRGQPWVEDPANRDPRYARSRLRALLPGLAGAGLTRPLLLGAAVRMADARAAMDAAVAALLVRCCRVYPAGFVRIARAPLAAAAPEVAVQALARVAGAVGGGERECDPEPVRRALGRLVEPVGGEASFGRCRLIGRGEDLLVCRERRRLPPPMAVAIGTRLLWDGRFTIDVRRREDAPETAGTPPPSLILRPLAPTDAPLLREACGPAWASLPAPVRSTLPVLDDGAGPLAAPLLGWRRAGPPEAQSLIVETTWTPRYGITGPGYFLAGANSFIIIPM